MVYCDLDNFFPYAPSWVWVYSGVYYLGFLYLVLSIRDFARFSYVAFSFIVLLAIHVGFFLVLPTTVPQEWRLINDDRQHRLLSHRVLRFVQTIDGPLNAFPSMHASVAVLMAFHAQGGGHGHFYFLFPVFVALSALCTKQHSVLDVVAGALLGWAVFCLWATVLFHIPHAVMGEY